MGGEGRGGKIGESREFESASKTIHNVWRATCILLGGMANPANTLLDPWHGVVYHCFARTAAAAFVSKHNDRLRCLVVARMLVTGDRTVQSRTLRVNYSRGTQSTG